MNGVNSGDALPGAAGSQPFTENGFGRHSPIGPVFPSAAFGFVDRQIPYQAVTKQFVRQARAEFRARPAGSLRASLSFGEEVRLSYALDASQHARAMGSQVKGRRAVADNDVALKDIKSFSGHPIELLRANHQAAIDALFEEPFAGEAQSLEKNARIADKGVIDGGGPQESREMTSWRVENGLRKHERACRGWVL